MSTHPGRAAGSFRLVDSGRKRLPPAHVLKRKIGLGIGSLCRPGAALSRAPPPRLGSGSLCLPGRLVCRACRASAAPQVTWNPSGACSAGPAEPARWQAPPLGAHGAGSAAHGAGSAHWAGRSLPRVAAGARRECGPASVRRECGPAPRVRVRRLVFLMKRGTRSSDLILGCRGRLFILTKRGTRSND